MITAREKNFLHGRSLRTMSQAMMPPSKMLPTDTHSAIIRELSSGRKSILEDTVLLRMRCQ